LKERVVFAVVVVVGGGGGGVLLLLLLLLKKIKTAKHNFIQIYYQQRFRIQRYTTLCRCV
jgi:hypothetical protein